MAGGGDIRYSKAKSKGPVGPEAHGPLDAKFDPSRSVARALSCVTVRLVDNHGCFHNEQIDSSRQKCIRRFIEDLICGLTLSTGHNLNSIMDLFIEL